MIIIKSLLVFSLPPEPSRSDKKMLNFKFGILLGSKTSGRLQDHIIEAQLEHF